MFIGKYNRSLIVTYLGVAFAILGMHAALLHVEKFAMVCLLLSGVCDLFDGKIARMCKRDKDAIAFGIQLDSLADIVSFVVFPIVFGLSLGLNEWYHVLGYALFAMAGIERLAYFNVLVGKKEDDKPVSFYSGLPVTSTSIIFPFLFLLRKLTGPFLYKAIYIVLIYLVALLFVANIKVPKFKGIAYPILAILAAVAIVLFFLI